MSNIESPLKPVRSTQLKLSLLITSVSLVALIVCFFIDFAQSSVQHWGSLIVKVVPLAYFQIEFRKQIEKTYAWFCFLLLVYFIFLMPLLNAQNSLLDWIQLALVVICFIAAMMTVRWLKQEARIANSSNSPHSLL